MPRLSWHAVVLAAGRGPDDPMAKAFGVAHKCALPVAGVPMLRRVIESLRQAAGVATPIIISIDNEEPARAALVGLQGDCAFHMSANSAPASARAAIEATGAYPVLITTGDHALLTPEMVDHVLSAAEASGADILAAMATSDVIQAAYPETRRTYFNLGGTRVSGCNLFAVMNARGLGLVRAWETAEKNRKKPWRLVAQFGVMPLLYYVLGNLTPERAFALLSRRLKIIARPVFMPFAEAAIDVDKPSDLEIAEKILRLREQS